MNMNQIPAELMHIANTCDVHKLYEEADTLQEIATMLLSQRNTPQKQLVMEEVVSPNDIQTN